MTTYNFTINQGSDWSLKLLVKDSFGLPVNLTGHFFQGQIREKYDSADSVADFSFVIANQVTNPGEIDVFLTNAQTAAIPTLPATVKNKRPAIDYIYDIEQTDGSLQKTRILEGIIRVVPSVIR